MYRVVTSFLPATRVAFAGVLVMFLVGPLLMAGSASGGGALTLANPRFEHGTTGWSPLRADTRLGITSHGRGGTDAIRIASRRVAPAGAKAARRVTDGSAAGTAYTWSAWTRGNRSGMKARMRVDEYHDGRIVQIRRTTVSLVAGKWRALRVPITRQRAGSRFAVRVLNPRSTVRDVLVVDDVLAAKTSPATTAPTTESGASPDTAVDLGIQFHGTWGSYDDTSRGLVLDKIKASGATWVRLDVGWSMIQPQPGTYDYGWGVPKVDRVIDQVNARGLKLLVMFWLTPSWANGGEGTRTAPDNPQDYANAIGWAANRWGSKVAAWEVWNEPNSNSFLTRADPVTYTRLLCPAYQAVHANDAGSPVVFGGVMFNDDDWIRRAYAAGAKGCFDVMATHPYLGPADAPPETADDGDRYTLRHVEAVHDLMVENGDGAKPIWATEFGWSSHANTGTEANWQRGVTEAQQADYAVRALRLFESDYPYVTKAFWYNEQEQASSSVQLNGYGMLTRGDLVPKPVFYAFRKHYLGY